MKKKKKKKDNNTANRTHIRSFRHGANSSSGHLGLSVALCARPPSDTVLKQIGGLSS